MKKKRHLMKRILALSLAGILCFRSVPQSVYASEDSSKNAQETTQSEKMQGETANELLQQEETASEETKDHAGESDATNNTEPEVVIPGAVRLKEAATPQAMAEEVETEAAEHTRLIVVSESDLTKCYGATECIRGYGNLHILSYTDVKVCESAYQAFTENGYTVEYDEVLLAPEEEETDGEAVQSTDTTLEEESKTAEPTKKKKQEIVVALIDTGVDTSSELLKGRVKENGETEDVHGHGTLMAEIIASQTPENVKILPIQAFDENGKGTVSTTYLAILEAIDNKVDVINLSVSGAGTSPMLESAIKKAKEAGIPVVVAAGNEAQDTAGFLPGNIEDAITVSATDETPVFAKEYSNYGEQVDFSAVGTVKKDNGTEDTADDVTYTGTSVSAAYVTSYAAWILSENANADVEECLRASATDLGEEGKDVYYGYGYLTKENLVSDLDREEEKKTEQEEDTEDTVTEGDGEQKLQTAASGFIFYQYGNGYVGVELRNYSSYGDMRIAVWCESVNGQDDLCWYDMTKRSDGVWIYIFPVANHAQEGWYMVHAYSGSTYVTGESFEIKGAISGGCSIIGAGNGCNMTGFASGIQAGSNNITQVQLAVWTEVNGQDNLCWYDMWYDANWGGYICSIPLINHNNLSYGVYNAHCYVTDSGGIRKCVAMWQDTVSSMTSYNTNMSKTRYHVEKVGTENCYHSPVGCAYVACLGQGLAPSDVYLWSSRYISNPTSHPLNVSWRWDPDFSNYGIGNEQISHQVLKAMVDGQEFPVAAPYRCPDGHAGYSYFYLMFSYCEKYEKWLYVGAMHQWLGCTRGDIGINEFHPSPFTHDVDVYGLKPNTYKVNYDLNGATYINSSYLTGLNQNQYTYDTYYTFLNANTFANRYNRVNYDAVGGSCTSKNTGDSYDHGYSAFLGWDDNTVLNTNNGLLYDCYGYQSTTTFNAAYYANIHPDLIRGYGYDKQALWNHYCLFGAAEGRSIRSGHGLENLDINDLYIPERAFRNLTYTHGGTVTLTARWEDPTVKLPTPEREGYTFLGWYKEDGTYAGTGGDSYKLSGTSTLHAKWKENECTLVFDGNGADIGSMENLTVHYNDTLKLPKNLYENTTIPCTYMGWMHDKDALKADYVDEEELEVKKIIKKAGKESEDGAVITLYAFWDIAPEIEAKDWYIGKKTAENMTEEQLLERAKATDREDGELERGTELVVVDFDKEDFLHLGQIGSCTVTYKATDSAGNITYKNIKVEVSEDGWLDMPYYIRFISEEFYGQKPENGGCVDGSVWNELPEYKKQLTDAFARIKNDTGVITYVFGRNDIKASHDFTEEHGFGEFQEDGALNLWLDAFAHCKQ